MWVHFFFPQLLIKVKKLTKVMFCSEEVQLKVNKESKGKVQSKPKVQEDLTPSLAPAPRF